MDNKDRDNIQKTMSENWKELSSNFFEMFNEHDCEWFPEGASTLDKEHISQVMLKQAEAIRTRVTNAFSKLFSCLHGIYFGCSL